MDRGRVGYAVSGNKSVSELNIKIRREEHLRRIAMIMNREPGTSKTLDNKPPNTTNARAINIRYEAQKKDFNKVTSRRNKALLKRIGKILTAPPRFSENTYFIMRKKESKGLERNIDKKVSVIENENKIFFDRVQKTKGHYDVNIWEEQYRKQLKQQKFLRQVSYHRPKNYTEPTSDIKDLDESVLSSNLSLYKPYEKPVKVTSPFKSSQIGRVRNIKRMKEINTNQHNNHINIDDDEEEDYDDEFDVLEDENRKELATTVRNIKILQEREETTESSLPNESNTQKNYKIVESYSEGDVSCWLLNNEVLLIIATANTSSYNKMSNNSEIINDNKMNGNNVVDNSTFFSLTSVDNQHSMNEVPSTVKMPNDGSINKVAFIQAEADIALSDLAALKNYKLEELLVENSEILLNLAKEIVDSVDIRIASSSEDDNRLILNLVQETVNNNSVDYANISLYEETNKNEIDATNHHDSYSSDSVYSSDVEYSIVAECKIANPNNPSVSQDDLAKIVTGCLNFPH